jgi:hypothetical protein
VLVSIKSSKFSCKDRIQEVLYSEHSVASQPLVIAISSTDLSFS